MRRAAKRDTSEKGIIAILESHFMSVYRLDQPVDLLVGFRGKTYLIECKTGHKGYGKGLNDNQARFAQTWRGTPVVTLHDEIGALKWAQGITSNPEQNQSNIRASPALIAKVKE